MAHRLCRSVGLIQCHEPENEAAEPCATAARSPAADAEFIWFGSLFHQDIDFRPKGFEQVIRDTADSFRGEDWRRLYDFIGQIPRSDLAPAELDKLWRLANSDIYINPEGLRFFFTLVQDRLRKGI